MAVLKIHPISFILTSIVIMLMTYLGFWQCNRAQEKQIQKHRIEILSQAPAINFSKIFPSPKLADIEYRRVLVRGHFLIERAVYLDNRPYRNQPGFYVIMPFQLEDDRIILVNRGWIPRNPSDLHIIAPYRTPIQKVSLEGIVRANATRVYEPCGIIRKCLSEKGAKIRLNIPINEYAKETKLDLLPYVLMQTNEIDDGLIRDWNLSSNIDAYRNYGYMLQWWSMAFVTLVGSIFAAWKSAHEHI